MFDLHFLERLKRQICRPIPTALRKHQQLRLDFLRDENSMFKFVQLRLAIHDRRMDGGLFGLSNNSLKSHVP
jgi:hypothetical protein